MQRLIQISTILKTENGPRTIIIKTLHITKAEHLVLAISTNQLPIHHRWLHTTTCRLLEPRPLRVPARSLISLAPSNTMRESATSSAAVNASPLPVDTSTSRAALPPKVRARTPGPPGCRSSSITHIVSYAELDSDQALYSFRGHTYFRVRGGGPGAHCPSATS